MALEPIEIDPATFLSRDCSLPSLPAYAHRIQEMIHGDDVDIRAITDVISGEPALVAGILKPTEGTLEVAGRAGGLFELAAGFHPELSGLDNIYLSGALMGYGRRTVEEKFAAIIEFSELEDAINIPVKTYSSGMALRLGFAIAIAFEPQVLLVDEVLAVADEHFQRKAYRNLERLQEQGSALLLVSHEMAAIRRMCARSIWLDDGRVVADADTAEVIEQYLAQHGEQNGH